MNIFTVTRWNSDVSVLLGVYESKDAAMWAVDLDKKFRAHNKMGTNYSYLMEEKTIATAQKMYEMEQYYYKAVAAGRTYI